MKKWFTGHPIEITTFKANAILKIDIILDWNLGNALSLDYEKDIRKMGSVTISCLQTWRNILRIRQVF